MGEKIKKPVKMILLILALIPYGIFLVLGVSNYLRTARYWYLYALVEPLVDFWIDNLVDLNPLCLCLAVFGIGYPIFYLLDRGTRKTFGEKKGPVAEPFGDDPKEQAPERKAGQTDGELSAAGQTEKTKKLTLSFFFYLICFIPYLILLGGSIFGVEFGFFGNVSTYYGWEAVALWALGLTFIPVLPVAVLYQAVFWICTRKRLPPGQKKISRVLFASIAGALILSCFVCFVVTKIRENSVYGRDKVIVEAYLREAFGETCAAEMEMEKPDGISQAYHVKTPVMDKEFLVCMDEGHREVTLCNFCEAYIESFDLSALLGRKLSETYHVPDNVELFLTIKGFPYQKAFEGDMDSLLESCEFELSCVHLNTERYDQKEILREITRFYTGCGRELLKGREDSYLYFYVREKEKYHACIGVFSPDTDPAVLQLRISGYTDSDGVVSVPEQELELSLKP